MPERSPVNQQKTPKRSPMEDKPERSPVVETPEVDEATWGEALKGSTIGLPMSFAKEIWNTVKGVPGMPALALGLAQEVYKSKDVPPLRGRVRGAGLSEERIRELEKSIYDFDMEGYADEFPIMNAIIQDYAERYGGVEELKKTLRDEPASILADIVTLLVPLAKAGKLGKFSAATAKYAPYLDPASAPEGLAKGVKKGAQATVDKVVGGRAKKYQEGFNPEVGGTGKTVTEMGKEMGLAEEDIPAMILSDVNKTRRREGVQYRSEDPEIANRVKERFEKSEEAIQNRGRIVGGFTDTEGVDLEYAGTKLMEDFDTVQDGLRGDFKQTFDDLNNRTFTEYVGGDPMEASVMDMKVDPLPTEDVRAQLGLPEYQSNALGPEDLFDADDPIWESLEDKGTYEPYFAHTIKSLMDLRKSDSKLLPSSEYMKIQGIFTTVLKQAEKDGFTIRDMDRLRTNFRRELEIAVNNGDITPVGAGEVSTKIYSALTQDLYNALEATVKKDPDAFGANFIVQLQEAKRDYANVQKLLETDGVKYLIRHQYKPTTLVNHILTKMETAQIDNVKKAITPEAWQNLQPALISSVLDKSLRAGEWSPGGLKKTLSSLGSRRLRYLFGTEKATELVELSAFSDRFARKNFLNSDALNDVVNRNAMEDFGWKIAQVIGTAGVSGIGYGAAGVKGAAISGGSVLSAMLVRYIGTKKFDKFINSPEGRAWMTRGDWELTIRVPGERFVKIVPQDLRRALAYTAMTTQRAEERQERKPRSMGFSGTRFRSGVQAPVQ